MATDRMNARLYAMLANRDLDGEPDDAIGKMLRVVRNHLGMDVAFVSRFEPDRAVICHVDDPAAEPRLAAGGSCAIEQSHCWHAVQGNIPGRIPDTAALPFVQNLELTRALDIGAYMTAPIVLPDGSIYGSFCCFSTLADTTLTDRDYGVLSAFAELSAYEINREIGRTREQQQRFQRVNDVLERHGDTLSVVLQPIWDLAADEPWGAEALCRFAAEPRRTPDKWFAEAETVDLREKLELAAIRHAVAARAALGSRRMLTVNISPTTILVPEFAAALAGLPLDRTVLELTEHQPVDDYEEVRRALAPMRRRGLRIAVDDAGGGYCSMSHILQLRPDIIKADMSLTRGIDTDCAKKAMMAAMVGFARATKTVLLAEGIETAAELATLRELGVTLAQGYLLGRPAPPAELSASFERGADAILSPRVEDGAWRNGGIASNTSAASNATAASGWVV